MKYRESRWNFFHEEVTKTFRENSPIINNHVCSMLKLEINCFSQKIDTFQHKGPNRSQKNCSWFNHQVQSSIVIQKFHKLLKTDHNRLGSVAILDLQIVKWIFHSLKMTKVRTICIFAFIWNKTSSSWIFSWIAIHCSRLLGPENDRFFFLLQPCWITYTFWYSYVLSFSPPKSCFRILISYLEF